MYFERHVEERGGCEESTMRRLNILAAAIVVFGAMGGAVAAQTYPARPVTLIVPFPAGEIGRAHV